MFDAAERPDGTKPEIYAELGRQLTGLFQGERDAIANAANMAALVGRGLADLNWAGFYIMRGDELVLGPFSGKPACVRIDLGKGVCGTAAVRKETMVVDDVDDFPGHIACDPASRSEIVIPVMRGNDVLAVFDLDSPVLARFDEDDQRGLEDLVEIFLRASDPF